MYDYKAKMIESLEEENHVLTTSIDEYSREYEDLSDEVVRFFASISSKRENDINDCIEDFKERLEEYCNIYIDEEVEKYEANQS